MAEKVVAAGRGRLVGLQAGASLHRPGPTAVQLPILNEYGWPVEYRGVLDGAPGLFFCGLSFQYAFSSMVFPGVGRDAEYVARRIVARSPAAEPAPAAISAG